MVTRDATENRGERKKPRGDARRSHVSQNQVIGGGGGRAIL